MEGGWGDGGGGLGTMKMILFFFIASMVIDVVSK